MSRSTGIKLIGSDVVVIIRALSMFVIVKQTNTYIGKVLRKNILTVVTKTPENVLNYYLMENMLSQSKMFNIQ